MKVRCIKKSIHGGLTISKTYEIIDVSNYAYEIIDDKCISRTFPKEHFKTLSEIRAEKIDKLLEDEC